jgi:hypothetical protein
MWLQVSWILVLTSVVLAVLKLANVAGIGNWSWWIIAIPVAIVFAPLIVVGLLVWFAFKTFHKDTNNQA